MTLERDAKNQEKFDKLQGIESKFAQDAQTNDYTEIDDDQYYEGEEEEEEFEPEYTEEEVAKWHAEAEYVEETTEYYE